MSMLIDLRNERWFISSLERGLNVINAFSGAKPALSISEIAKHSGTSRASARRIAMTLEALGYLGRSEGNQYYLTPKTLALGTAYLSSHGIGDALQPILRRLRDMSGRSSSISVLDGEEIIYVARASASGPLRVHINVGQRLPAYATAMGRVLLAALSHRDFEAWLRDARLEPVTEATITDPSKFRAAIETVRADGYCVVEGELGPGIKVLAVPIVSAQGTTVAALNLTTQSAFDRERDVVAEFLPEVRRAAAEISGVWNHLQVRNVRDMLDPGPD